MSGPEHYREAEKLLGNIRLAIAADGPEAEGGIPEWTAIAQVHATLALAAATALGALHAEGWADVAAAPPRPAGG
jgi:hypothetical protein